MQWLKAFPLIADAVVATIGAAKELHNGRRAEAAVMRLADHGPAFILFRLNLGALMPLMIESAMKHVLAVSTLLFLGACSWGIKLDSAGRDVRVAWNDDVSQCRQVGSITVSVLDKVGPVRRGGLKVSDELEVMARNQAGSLPADTIKPLGEPRNGEQNWTAYVCGRDGARATLPPRDTPQGGVETYPIKEH